jgi:hypothetical protein
METKANIAASMSPAEARRVFSAIVGNQGLR